MDAMIIDEDLREVAIGCEGELIMTGPQLSKGYWCDEEKTKRAFVSVKGREGVYYRTGDRVRRPGRDKPMVYLGRLDNQIKILGHRVELGEVETVIHEHQSIAQCAVVSHQDQGGETRLVAYCVRAKSAFVARFAFRSRQKNETRNARVVHVLGQGNPREPCGAW
jgi:acyl-coenzyme A synthetase/AMP-(fatty) acid ligase